MERKNLELKIQPWKEGFIGKIKKIIKTNSDINKDIEVVKEAKHPFSALPLPLDKTYTIILLNDLHLAPRNPKNDYTKYDVNLKDLRLRHYSDDYYYRTGGGPEREVKLPILHKLATEVLKDQNFLVKKAGINSHSGSIKHILFNRLMLAELVQFSLLAKYNINEKRGTLEYIANIKKIPAYKFLEELNLEELNKEKERIKRINGNLKLVEMNRILIFPNKKLARMYNEFSEPKERHRRHFSLEENIDYGTPQSIFTFTFRPYSKKQNRVFIYLPVVLIEQGQLKLDNLNEENWELRNVVREYIREYIK